MDKPINQIINIKSLDELKTYLEQRAELNLSLLLDKTNCTLLHFAAFKNDLPRIKIFIKHFKEFTEAHHGPSVYKNTNDNFIDKLRAWVNSPNKQGYIPILYAALHGNLQMIQFLEQCGSNMHFRTTKNENVLFMCVENCRVKPLIYLIQSKNNYDIGLTNHNGDTILHQASGKGFTQIVSYLLTIGAEINKQNNDGQTALMTATKQSKKEVIKLLLIKGADRAIGNKEGKTPLDIARGNNKLDVVKILDNDYGCWDKFKIKCNKKIVYQPEDSSYLYSIFFIVLFHLFFLPANLLSEFGLTEKYIKMIPMLFEGMYQIVILVLYFFLLKKAKLKKPVHLLEIQGNFCAQCQNKLSDRAFHCYICKRCVYRYDHHCPWINNCVGAHNIGKFILFLLILIIGLAQVTFCSICLLIGDTSFVRYRKSLEVPDAVHLPLNIFTIVFSSILCLGLLKLFAQQLRNLFTNKTSFERQKKGKSSKRGELLGSETSLIDSTLSQTEEDKEKQPACNCLGNCMSMLFEQQ